MTRTLAPDTVHRLSRIAMDSVPSGHWEDDRVGIPGSCATRRKVPPSTHRRLDHALTHATAGPGTAFVRRQRYVALHALQTAETTADLG
jgi:hypothetical protein